MLSSGTRFSVGRSHRWAPGPLAIGALAIGVALVASGCAPERALPVPEATETAASEVAISFIPRNIRNAYFTTSDRGGATAIDEFGGKYTELGPVISSPGGQNEFIDAVAEQGVEGIVISASDPTASCDSLNAARDSGIKVVTFDRDAQSDCRDVFINQATPEAIAKVQVDLIADQIDETGTIAILSGSADSEVESASIELMKAELAENYPNISIVDVVYGENEEALSFTKTGELLTEHPDLSGIISPSVFGLSGAAKYLSASPLKGKVKLTGLGTPNLLRPYITDGTITAFALWNPADLGYLAAYAVHALITGSITGEKGDTFSAGTLGDFAVGDNGVVELGEPYVFDKSNIEKFDF